MDDTMMNADAVYNADSLVDLAPLPRICFRREDIAAMLAIDLDAFDKLENFPAPSFKIFESPRWTRDEFFAWMRDMVDEEDCRYQAAQEDKGGEV